MDKSAESCSGEGRNEGSIRQTKIERRGAQSLREGILTAVMLTRNPSRKSARRKTDQVDVLVLSVRLLITVRPRLVVITAAGVSRRMKRGLIECSLWLLFYFTRPASFPTHEAANATDSDFKSQKNHNYGDNVHDVPPLFDFACDLQESRKHTLTGQEGPIRRLHGFLSLTQ